MQKRESENMPHVKREEWDVEKLNEQGVNEMPDELLRKTLRGDEGENKKNADERDIVGSVDSNETPQGREESKNDTRSKANING